MARPAKPLISRSAAIHAAIEIIDADGLGTFSLPRLAAHMGVRAPSLYHHFRNKVDSGQIQIKRVDTKNQIADIFTKALPRVDFERIRMMLLGW